MAKKAAPPVIAPLPLTLPVPSLDPLPWLTERYRESGAFQRDPYAGRLTDHAVHAMRGTIQSVVSGLQDDAKVFRAVFGKTATASTDIKGRIVYIGTAAMQDPNLSDGRLAAIMTGLAYHEVAHVNHDRAFQSYVIKALSGHEGAAGAHDAHNIGQDLRIEDRIARALPGYAPTLPATLWYITKGTRVTHMPAGISRSAARNLFFAAVRAPWSIEDWGGWEDALAWGQEWRRLFIETDKRADVIDLVRDALDHIIEWASRAPVEAPEPPTCGPTFPQPPQPPSDDDEVRPPDPWAEGPDEQEPDETSSPPPADPDEDEDEDDLSEESEEDDEEEPEDPDGPGGPTSDDDEDDDEDDLEDDEDEDGGPTDSEDEDEDDLDDEDDEEDGPTGRSSKSDEDDEDEPDIEPDEDPENPVEDEVDRSKDWSDDVADTEGGGEAGTGEALDAEVVEGVSIEDMEFPACAAEALLTSEDGTFQKTASRIERAREEERTRTYEHDGFPPRKVRRIWDF